MKFVLLIEEDGYQVRYWDEITNSIGECIAEAWEYDKLYDRLKTRGFNIKHRDLKEAISMIEEKPFVVLSSHIDDNIDLDTFINSMFTIDKE